MKRTLLSLLTLAVATLCVASAQPTPTYMHVVPPKGRLQQCIWEIDQAKALGYEGVVLPVGTNSIQDPDRTDWSPFEKAVKECARLNLRVHLRLMQDVPVSTFSGGVRTGSSKWVGLNGGVAWDQPFRPPVAVCAAIAQRVWQVALDKTLAVMPADRVSLEETNEPCDGGAGARYAGANTAAGVYSNPGRKEGFIDPYFFEMLWALQSNFDPKGCRLYAFTLEGQQADNNQDGITDAQLEIDSIKGVFAQAVLLDPKVRGVGFNRYCQPFSTLSSLQTSWGYRAGWEIKHIRANPIISDSIPIFITEMGVATKNNLSPYTIDRPRNALIRTERSFLGIDGAGMFLAQSTNSLNGGFQLWDSGQGLVGGAVGPIPAGQ